MKISILCALIGIFISGCESSSSTTTSKTTIRGNGGSGNDGGSSNNNDEILKIEREQQEIAKVEQDRDDKLNAMLAEIKTGDYLKNEASYQKARDYFRKDFLFLLNEPKKNELINELKKNTLIAKTLTDYSNDPIYVFNSKTLDDFKNLYDPQRIQEQEKKRQEESKNFQENFAKAIKELNKSREDLEKSEKEAKDLIRTFTKESLANIIETTNRPLSNDNITDIFKLNPADKEELLKRSLQKNSDFLSQTLNNANVANENKEKVVEELFSSPNNNKNNLKYGELLFSIDGPANIKIKNNVAELLETIFTLGDKSIISFYDYITPPYKQNRKDFWGANNFKLSDKAYAVLDLLKNNDDLFSLVTAKKEFMAPLAKLLHHSSKKEDKDIASVIFAKEILDKLSSQDLKNEFKAELKKLHNDYNL